VIGSFAIVIIIAVAADDDCVIGIHSQTFRVNAAAKSVEIVSQITYYYILQATHARFLAERLTFFLFITDT